MVINPIVGVYIPIIRIPIRGGRFPIPPKKATFDHGTYEAIAAGGSNSYILTEIGEVGVPKSETWGFFFRNQNPKDFVKAISLGLIFFWTDVLG